mgnify:CR=1 FL=1
MTVDEVSRDEVPRECKHQFCDAAGNRVYLYCQRGCGTMDTLEAPLDALDDIARQTRAAMDGDPDSWSPSHEQTLAMIARIRELEAAIRGIGLEGDNGDCNCDAIRDMGSSKPEHRIAGHEPDCVATDHLARVLSVLEKCAVLP